MHIRRAAPTDIDAIAGLFDQYRVFYGKESNLSLAAHFMSERMRLGESVVFLAEMPDAKTLAMSPAGFVQLYPGFSSGSAARLYVLNDLFVSQAHRRQGIARGLMLAAQTFANEQEAGAMRLSTDKANVAGQTLYESLGWARDTAYFHYDLAVKSGPSVQ